MNGNDLLNAFGEIDEKFINEAENKKVKKNNIKFILPVAACLAVVLVSAVLLFGKSERPPAVSVPRTEVSNKAKYMLNFNEVKNVSSYKRAIDGHFWYELNGGQLKKVLPGVAEKYETEATVSYSHEDGVTKLVEVSGVIKKNGKNVSVIIAENEVFRDYVIDGAPLISDIEGVKVEAGIYVTPENTYAEHKYWYYADFLIDNVAYKVEYHSDKRNDEFFTEIVAEIILGGKADLSVLSNPKVPYLRDDKLTEEEAYIEKDFGAYLPKAPKDFAKFNEAKRFVNQNSNYLSISKSKGYSDVRFKVSRIMEDEEYRIVTPADTVLYDMSLYPVPWCDSIPEDISAEEFSTIQNPIFKIEDLTLDMVKKRSYSVDDPGDTDGERMMFSVLYGDILVDVSTEGVSPEYVFNELSKLPRK